MLITVPVRVLQLQIRVLPVSGRSSTTTMEYHRKRRKKNKIQTPESKFRADFDICSKKKDLSGAISLFDSAVSQEFRLNLHHYNCLLYICSTSITDQADELAKKSAIEQGFRIYDHMILNKVNPNEATITAVSRLAAAKDDSDLAFELVKSLRKYNEKPRLRTYEPALFCYVKKLDAENAYLVERDVLDMGLSLEEPQIAGLLKVSVEVGKEEKVYEYLHKLRGGVRCVSESTAEIIEGWFGGQIGWKVVGAMDCDSSRVKETILKNGGGWHGLGWMGKGKWVMQRSNVDSGGCCCACKEQLACVDIGREETQKFAQSLVGLALEREAQSNFTEFQNWLDQRNNFEAIVDGANIGLYQQNFAEGGFSISQLEIVVKELYNRSKKWPLVILHNKRIRALRANPYSRELLDEWISKGLLYGTPVGSNDDWYWLYASVKLGCMLVTNDEMRDHIFELLGSSFFPMWKERHQVRYTFQKGELKFQMPPSYSLVIQESARGAWHVPLTGEYKNELSRPWLCITRPGPCGTSGGGSKLVKASEIEELTSNNGNASSSTNSDTAMPPAITGKRKERPASLPGDSGKSLY